MEKPPIQGVGFHTGFRGCLERGQGAAGSGSAARRRIIRRMKVCITQASVGAGNSWLIVSVQAALEGHPGDAALHGPAFLHDLEAAVITEGSDPFFGGFLARWEPIVSDIEI